MIIIVGTIIELLCICFILHGYYKKQYVLTAHDFIALSSLTLLLDFSQTNQGFAFWVAGQVLYIIFILSGQRSSMLNTFLLYMIVSLTMVQIVVTVAVTILQTPESIPISYQKVIYNLVGLLIIVGLVELANMERSYIWIAEASLSVRIALVDGYILFLAIVLIYKLTTGRVLDNPVSVSILVLFLIATGTSVLYYEQLVREKTRELEHYQKNIPIYESLISEIKSSQHEFANRLQGIQNLAVICNDYETLRNELLVSTKQYAVPFQNYPLLKINMPLLAASLYHLTTVAEARGIIIRFEILSNEFTSFATEPDLSDFVCIFIQNAVEACARGDVIYVILSSEKEKVRIEVRNPVPDYLTTDEIAQFFQKKYSTKQTEQNSERGLGLYYLRRKIMQYKGTITTNCIRYEDGTYWLIMGLEV